MNHHSTGITYRGDVRPDAAAVISLYDSSGIRRPTGDAPRIRAMLEHANLIITAWDGDLLVGLARSLTDFCYCCYLSDLAVRKDYQRQGIGRELVRLTRQRIGAGSMLLLLSAPSAMEYYPKIGFERAENAFMIGREQNQETTG